LLTAYELSESVEQLGVVPEAEGGFRQNYLKLNEEFGLEWVTAGDSRVCERCQARAGDVYTPEEIRSGKGEKPPLHPNCRCKLVPLGAIYSSEEVKDKLADHEPDVDDQAIGKLPQDRDFDDIETGVSKWDERNRPLDKRSFMSSIDRNDDELLDPVTDDAGDLSVEKIKEVSDEAAEDFVDNKKLRVRVPPEKLDSIIDDGRLKTQFDVDSSQGSYAPHTRKMAEKVMFNKPDDMPTDKRPVYGYIKETDIKDDGSSNDLLTQYGDAKIELEEEVKSRTTFTNGDTLTKNAFDIASDQARLNINPNPINNPDRTSFSTNDISESLLPQKLRKIKGETDDVTGSDLGSARYAEAQVHDGVELSDFKKISLPESELDEDQLERLRQAADENEFELILE
jgi:hypothetical protein